METTVKERPILFSGPMVRAILEGRKTQTRRVLRVQPDGDAISFKRWEITYHHENILGKNSFVEKQYRDSGMPMWLCEGPEDIFREWGCPYGDPGDRLWVRENWRVVDNNMDSGILIYRYQADELTYPTIRDTTDYFSKVTDETFWKYSGSNYDSKIRPSIFMPHWASRITLEVTKVRVERLQSISEEDARAEGVSQPYSGYYGDTYVPGFEKLWDSINDKRGFGWEANPWVWVIDFKKS